jgi:hypothetical protein
MGDAQQQLQQQLAALEARCAEGDDALAAAEARAADRQRAYHLLHSDLQVRSAGRCQSCSTCRLAAEAPACPEADPAC